MADEESYTVPVESLTDEQRERLEQVRDLGRDPEEFWPYVLDGDGTLPSETEDDQ